MISNDWTATVVLSLSDASDDARALPTAEILTSSAASFFHHHNAAFGVLFGAIDSAVFADNAAFVARAVLEGDKPLPRGFDPHKMLSEESGPHLRRLRSTQRQMLEMIYIRLADNFLNYIMDVVAECINGQPNLLRAGKDQIAIDAVLEFQTLEELRAHLIERKLISIAYLGLDKQLDWIADHLGLEGVKDRPCYPSVVELVEARNCMVHGRGKVGDKFIKAVAPFGVTLARGHQIDPTVDDLFIAARASAELVNYVDQDTEQKIQTQDH